MRGVLHVHSIFSDGEEPLDRIVRAFSDAGMKFIAVSDHAEVFDEQRMQEYVTACEALSTAHFLVIPGLEFALKGGSIHILGYGITKRVRAPNMDQLVDGIHEAGGIAVLAHPPRGSINMISAITEKLDGIEIWNSRYDGTLTPRAESIQLLRSIRSSNLGAVAFCGVDLHEIGQARKPVYVDVETETLSRCEILNALRAGSFTLRGGRLAIPASGKLTFVQELSIAVRQPMCRPW